LGLHHLPRYLHRRGACPPCRYDTLGIRPIIVLDDSDLSTARSLYGLVGKLGGRGSLLDRKKLAKAIQAKIAQEAQDGVSETANGQVVYGISHGHDLGTQGVLDLGADVKMKKDFKGRRFPPGRYS